MNLFIIASATKKICKFIILNLCICIAILGKGFDIIKRRFPCGLHAANLRLPSPPNYIPKTF